MVKKKFIDKKSAVTYSLVYRSTEDADDQPERVLLEAAGGVHGEEEALPEAVSLSAEQPTGRRYPPGHPLAWLEAEEAQEAIPEGRRRELVELGFPDDGYDYLRHVRTLGRGGSSLETLQGGAQPSQPADTGPVGPSVFVSAPAAQVPAADIALFDASALTVMQPAEEDDEAARMMGGVTAFSRPQRPDATRAAERRELAELEAAMAEAEEEADVAEDVVDGDGDLLDDFILAATEAEAAAAAAAAPAQHGQGGQAENGDNGASLSGGEEEEEGGWSSDESYSGSDEGEGTQGRAVGLPSISGRVPPRPGSIASTYWREERTDRRKLLGVIDERFEALALQYEEEDIGDMEESAEAGDIAGFAEVAEFDAAMQEFLTEHGRHSEPQGEEASDQPAVVHSALREELESYGFDDNDAGVAIAAARASIRRCEEEEAAGGEGGAAPELVMVEVDPAERWDCETVLSLRSNLYNHPGTITEPARARPPAMIRLNKSGIPLGVLPARGSAAGSGAGGAAEADGEKDMEGDAGPTRLSAAALERKKDESAEEKRARKNAVKVAKREARSVKKELKGMYKQEEARAARRAATAQVQPAVLL